jgi:putative addiction module component (TIGR02574 family)
VSATSEQILQQALALPPEERAELLEQLLAAFQGPTDPALDELWAAEAHDRLDAYDRGELEAVDVEEVLQEIDEKNI